MNHYVRLFTTAPVDYDYGHTHESIDERGTFDAGTRGVLEVRTVFTEATRAEGQIARYSSGLYATWTEETAIEEMKYPYLQVRGL